MSPRRRNRRIAAGAGLSLGAALGMNTAAQAADFTVDRTGDPSVGGAGGCVLATPTDCSLRQALVDAENGNRPVVDHVLFAAGLSGTITLNSAELSVSEPVDIQGPGAKVLSVSGNDSQRILYTSQGNANDPVTISGLTLTAGYGSGVRGGGAIDSTRTDLTIESSTISDSDAGSADFPGGGIAQRGGQLVIRNSTISGNDGANGGGLYSIASPVLIASSTISDNTASGVSAGYGYGGGIWLTQGTGGNLVVYGGTITGNHARYGGGVSAAASTMGLGDTVVANNTAAGEVDLRNAGADPFKLAHTLVESPPAAGSTIDIPAFAGSNVFGVDPQLGPLTDNGGPTRTEKPALTSPLLDKGLTTVAPLVDQRGLPRPFDISSIANTSTGDAADIGAVELQASDFATPPAPPGTPPAVQVTKPRCKKKKKKSAAQIAKKKCKKKKKKK